MDNSLVLFTGGSGMVGKACSNRWSNAIYVSSKDLNLLNEYDSIIKLNAIKPKLIVHIAAAVGGLYHNINNNAQLYEDNVRINTTITSYCLKHNIPMIAMLSTCIFPGNMHEFTINDIHYGEPHNSNIGYAYAKRMLHISCKINNWKYIIPCNIYGPHDNFHITNGHVIPGLIHKCYLSKKYNYPFIIFGNGESYRQFIYVDDVVDSIGKVYDQNISMMVVGEEVTIKELVTKICTIYEFHGDIVYENTMSNGIDRKKGIDCEIASTKLDEGLVKTIQWFNDNYPNVRGYESYNQYINHI